MLDAIFYHMAADEYAHWLIHARLCSVAGDIEISVPHFYCDGRKFMRTIPGALMSLGRQHQQSWCRANSTLSDAAGGPLAVGEEQTWFQTLLGHLIEIHGWDDDASIALAVDVSSELDSEASTQGNQVAFPLFKKNELLRLCRVHKKEWADTVMKAALLEFENYRRIGKLLPRLSPNKRREIYEKIPLHSAQAVVSYFGNIDRFIDADPAHLESLDFGGSTSRGPRHTVLGYTLGSTTFFRTTEAGAGFSWNGNVHRFTRE